MAYRTIVAGTDGSLTAGVAVGAAVRLAKRCQAKMVLISALSAYGLTRPILKKALRDAAALARQSMVEVIGELDKGTPAEAILEAAERHSADLIVVGNKGIGAATRFRLGSVPDHVAHDAPCDLLIVDTSRAAKVERPSPPYQRILAATDGSPTATEAARKAFELAAIYGGTVTLLHVGDPLVGAIKLDETASGRPEGVEVLPRAVEGDPAERICEIAEQEDVDLVVVGNKGMAGVRRFLGSVPNKVAHEAPTDVLIVKTVDRSVDDLAFGHGGLVDVEGERLAVYRDGRGDTYLLSPRCTHMGCTVDWNDAAKTWDCPCHGSRFAVDGSVVRGPATRPLERVGGTAPVLAPGWETPPVAEEQARPERDAARPRERFVIIGAGLAGATAAGALREEGFAGDLVLIGAEAAFPYERPPLSKSFLRGETTLQESMVHPEVFYSENEIETHFGSTVTSIDPGTRKVIVAGGDPISYDRLLIATGARTRRLPITGIDLNGIYELRTVADAARIRSEMLPGRKAVLVGMGFIGSEVAASFRQRGLEVHVVDSGSVPLERVLGEPVGRVLEGIHRDHGVEMNFGDRVAGFEGTGRAEAVITKAGLRLECDLVVLGMGVEPVTDLLVGSGIEVDNGVLVDEFCRTNVEGVFAAGDVANHLHPVFARRVRIEHWHNAREQGRAAAWSMLGKGTPYDVIHWFWSDQFEHTIQYAGFHTEWDELLVRGSLDDRSFAAFYMKEGRVQAVAALDRPTEVQRATSLIRAGEPVAPEALRDEAVDLRALA